MKKVNDISLLLLVCFLMACNSIPQQKAEDTAVDFSKAMYNLQFEDAKTMCTPNTSAILSFIASNLKEENIEMLKKAGEAKISVIESTLNPGDSTATVTLKVSNYLQLNMMSGKSTIEKEKEETIDLVKVNDKWLVDMHK